MLITSSYRYTAKQQHKINSFIGKDFNELPSEIKNIDNLKNFKIALTDFVKVK
jgi:hypothetical protein